MKICTAHYENIVYAGDTCPACHLSETNDDLSIRVSMQRTELVDYAETVERLNAEVKELQQQLKEAQCQTQSK